MGKSRVLGFWRGEERERKGEARGCGARAGVGLREGMGIYYFSPSQNKAGGSHVIYSDGPTCQCHEWQYNKSDDMIVANLTIFFYARKDEKILMTGEEKLEARGVINCVKVAVWTWIHVSILGRCETCALVATSAQQPIPLALATVHSSK